MANESFQKIVERLVGLDRARKLLTTQWVLASIITLLVGAFLTILVFSFLFTLPASIRIAVWLILGGTFIYLTGLRWLPMFLRRANLYRLARLVEAHFPDLENRLVAALDCQRFLQEHQPNYSPELMAAVIVAADRKTENLDFARVLDRQPLKKALRLAGLTLAATFLLSLVSPANFRASFRAFLHPTEELKQSPPFQVLVSPGSVEVVKFTPVTLKATAIGQNLPRRLFVNWQNEGGQWQKELLSREALSPTANGIDTAVFTYAIREAKKNFTYFFSGKNFQSEAYAITVVDIPRVTDIRATLTYPAYSRLGAVTKTDNDGNLQALTGTRVTLSVETNKPVDKATLVFGDGTSKQMNVRGKTAAVPFPLTRSTTYHIQVVDHVGNANRDPIEYTLTALPDAPPSVEIVRPGSDLDLSEEMQVGLEVKAQDDYGFSTMLLKYQIVSHGISGAERKKELSGASVGTELIIRDRWDLANLPLVPGDLVRYWVEVADNDNISGPKWAKSKTYHLRLPSLDEILSEATQKTDENISDLEKVLSGEKDLNRKLEELSRRLAKDQKLSWETKEEVQKLAAEHLKFLENLNKVADQQHETAQKMAENRLAQQELVEKMQEMQKLLDEVASPELKAALRKLQQALDQLDPEQVRQALEKFQIDQEALIAKLDRTIELLKRLATEQKLDALLKMAEKLLQGQKEVNAKTQASPADSLPQVSPDEKALEKQLDQLTQKASDLKRELQADPEFNIPQSAQFCDRPGQSGAKPKMQKMQQALQQAQKKPSEQAGAEAQEEMESMFASMLQARQGISQCRKKGILGELRKALEDALYLSESQEKLAADLNTSDASGRKLRQFAQEQNDLKTETERLSQRLEGTAKKSFFVPQPKNSPTYQAVARMQQAVTHLSNCSRAGAQQEQTEALYQLNQTAKELLSAIQNAAASSCGSGGEELLQKMQNLSNMQLGINEQGMSLLPPNQPAQDQLASLQRLRAEQEVVKKSMEELQREYGSRKEILGRLDELGKEVEKVLEDFDRQNYGSQTLDRQKKILSRLLEYNQSLERRDYTERRQAEFGEDIIRRSPQLSREQIEKAQRQSDTAFPFGDEPYPPEYEQVIKNYLKAYGGEAPRK